jgi:hypothetical protein
MLTELYDIATIAAVERTEALDLREGSLRMRRNDMQPNRVWIAVLLVMLFAVSLTMTAEAQESGAPNDAAWRRADELLKKLTLDEKLQLILSKYPSNASPGGGGGYIEGVTRLHIPDINSPIQARVQGAQPSRVPLSRRLLLLLPVGTGSCLMTTGVK